MTESIEDEPPIRLMLDEVLSPNAEEIMSGLYGNRSVKEESSEAEVVSK